MTRITPELVEEHLTELALSLHGLDVWRQYRADGMQRSLLLDLHGDPNRDYEKKLAHVCDVLMRFQRSAAFAGMPALVTMVSKHVFTLPSLLQRDFNQHYFVLHRQLHDALNPNVYDDDYFYSRDFVCVKQFVTLLLDPDKDEEVYSLRAMLTPLWVGLCDAALTVDR